MAVLMLSFYELSNPIKELCHTDNVSNNVPLSPQATIYPSSMPHPIPAKNDPFQNKLLKSKLSVYQQYIIARDTKNL